METSPTQIKKIAKHHLNFSSSEISCMILSWYILLLEEISSCSCADFNIIYSEKLPLITSPVGVSG